MTARNSDTELGQTTQAAFSDQLGRCSLPLLALFAGGIVMAFRRGFDSTDAILVYGGAVACGLAMLFYVFPTLWRALSREKSGWMFFAALGGFIPYVWALYIMAVPGIWSLIQGSSGLVSSGIYIVAGYWYLRTFWKLTELVRALDTLIAERQLSNEGMS